ncbi:MAG: thiopurine S-methyltransferase [Bacteroidetes bacterium]|nr:thiopurine S-methyltransferase [Bacteroidota bacterium]
MELSYWQSRWRKGKTGFHMERVYPGLTEQWGKIPADSKSAVLVPLCGKSLDLSWLASRCRKVIGVETSEIAVQAFFSEQNLDPGTKTCGRFKIFSAENITVWCGDFFHLPNSSVEDVSMVYDKAAMVALPPDKRADYRKKLTELTGDNVPILLHHFEYDPSEMNGPPFAVSPSEVKERFGLEYDVVELLKNPLDINIYKKFRKRGLQSFFIEYLSLLLPKNHN